MGIFGRQWLLRIRICCHDSDYLTDSGIYFVRNLLLTFSICLAFERVVERVVVLNL